MIGGDGDDGICRRGVVTSRTGGTRVALAALSDLGIYPVCRGLCCRTAEAILSVDACQSRGAVCRGPNRVLPRAIYDPGFHDETNYVCAESHGSWSETGPYVAADYPSSRGTGLV